MAYCVPVVVLTLPYLHLQLLQELLQQFQEMDEELRTLWVSPSDVQLSADVIADGGTSRVHHGLLRGMPVAVKVYDRRCQLTRPQSPAGAPSSVEQLMTGTLSRKLCLIARANRESHHVCR
jgi:hypothetical protein